MILLRPHRQQVLMPLASLVDVLSSCPSATMADLLEVEFSSFGWEAHYPHHQIHDANNYM